MAYLNSNEIEFNILDANTFEFTLPLDVSSSGGPEVIIYNDTSLTYEVELSPNT